MAGGDAGRLLNTDDFVVKFAGADADSCRGEFDQAASELHSRRAAANYGQNFDIETATAWSLFAHVRIRQPAHVLETGVANGVSSHFLLSALRLNGAGQLHSLDIDEDVGRLVADQSDWDLHVLSRNRPAASLRRFFENVPPLELFIHDSLHTYAWMRREFRLAAESVKPGGWIAADDADGSAAFPEFCAERALEPLYLFDARKFFGVVQLPAGARAYGDT